MSCGSNCEPGSVVTRPGFAMPWRPLGYMPPPLHVQHACPEGNWYPAPRPFEATRGVRPGPPLIYGGGGLPSLGIDPTDETTWGSRGYRPCAGMIGRFNTADAWIGEAPPGSTG